MAADPARLHIDWTRCDGRGLCTELLPELLDRDPWGYPLPKAGGREPVVPAALREHARTAVRHCPRLALSLRGADLPPPGAAAAKPQPAPRIRTGG